MDLMKGPPVKQAPAWTVEFESINEFPYRTTRVTIRTFATTLNELERIARDRADRDKQSVLGMRFRKAYPVGQAPVVDSEKAKRRRGKGKARRRRF